MAQSAIVRRSWPLGFTPSADPINGDPSGLIRMDNLRMDQVGVLSLARGIQRLDPSGFPDFPDQIYSKNINGNDSIWLSLGSQGAGGTVRSLKGDFSDTVTLPAGSNAGCFGDCLGEILCISGKTRLKDNLTKIQNLGFQTPGAPAVGAISQPSLQITGTWTTNEGTQNAATSTGIYALVSPTTLRTINTLAAVINTTIIDGGANKTPGNDIFQFNFTPDDSSVVEGVAVAINLKDGSYYQYSFDLTNLLQGPQQTTLLSATRSQFTRHGTGGRGSGGNVSDWSDVVSFQFLVQCTSEINIDIDEIGFYGGVIGTLNGEYSWIQVNVTDNGYYVAKSQPSPSSVWTTVVNGNAVLTPSPVEASVTDIWYFRTTIAGSQVNSQSSFLDQYYQVATGKPGQPVTDATSDDDAIQIDIVLNPYLLSLQPLTDGFGITEDIFAVEGLYNERMLYMSVTSLYLSDQLNPDSVDGRFTIKVSGDPTEFNVWIKKLTNNVLILATSKNLYEISGTLLELPDGTIDATITPIGENYPPIGTSGSLAVSAGGSIFYVASDGIRATSGSNSQLISPQLNLLFQGETRSGLPGVVINNYARYAIAIGRGRLLVCLPLTDGSRWLFIYDLLTQTWRVQYTDPVSLFVTFSDRVLLGYEDNGVGQLYELDKQLEGGFYDNTGILQDGYAVNFQTVFDDNQQPNNRKDTFTLKIVADTGGNNHSVYIAVILPSDTNTDNPPDFIFIGNLNTDGIDTRYYDLSTEGITLGFKYAVKIVDVDLTTKFNLYEITIDYDARPEQLNYIRIQPNNLGTMSRKRFTSYSFIVDTMGNEVTFTPIVDNKTVGVTPLSITFNTPVKQTYIYYFTEEVIGTDISGILSGGVFELY